MTPPLNWDELILQHTERAFGEEVMWHPLDGQPSSLSGIFDEGFNRAERVESSMGLSPIHVTTSQPILGCRAAAFSSPPQQGDTLIIRGRPYVIQEVQPDSHGALHLALNEGES